MKTDFVIYAFGATPHPLSVCSAPERWNGRNGQDTTHLSDPEPEDLYMLTHHDSLTQTHQNKQSTTHTYTRLIKP